MPASSSGSSRPTTLEPVHDFSAKLRQPSLWPQVVDYVRWQRALRQAEREGLPLPAVPPLIPISINLDLTTACNYACDHCIDWDILNSPVKHEDQELRAALQRMAKGGLKSVILIGGGEPTLYPGFVDFVRYLKELELQVAVVSNGSRGDKLLAIAPYFDERDWIRLSLDSGTNATFQRMHHPSKKDLTLDEICGWVTKIKQSYPKVTVGFSYVMTWKGASRDDVKVVENLHEMELAARRARDAGFDYISFKPFLLRAANGSEVMDPKKAEEELAGVIARIRVALAACQQLARPGFRVVESTNLRVLLTGTWQELTRQPKTCHMQALRQVLTPHGTFNCPAYRGVTFAQIGPKDAYADAPRAEVTARATQGLLQHFDASDRCKEVTCLYHGTNWWIEKLVESSVDPASLELVNERFDHFL